MILRRLALHIKEQNWFAVWLDLAIVVIGVFIGIQVSNWNSQRADAERAIEYLERLDADLVSDAQNIKARQVFYAQVLAYGDQALTFAEADPSARRADWPTVLAFFQASQLFTYYRNDATYDELKSAGELSLFKNQKLQSALADYFVTMTGSQENIFEYYPLYRETVRGLTPSTVIKHVWANCHTHVDGLDAQAMRDCDSPISDEEAKHILEGYLADPELLKQLRFWMSTLSTTHSLLGISLYAIEMLRKQIKAELEK